MNIEVVTVCRDYSDFLEHTLPENLNHVDRMVVVTHPSDKRTIALCNRFGVDVIQTTVFNDDGDKFNKWRGLNLGLSHLRHSDWLLCIDADVLLPHRFRERLKQAKLDTRNIYGADRLNVGSFENWQKHKHKTIPQHKWRFMVQPQADYPIGARVLHQEYGYCPIGYFQLWHSSRARRYPIVNGSAEHGDLLFAVQWPREERVLLPEFFVYHLESEQAEMGINWKGRKTKPFGDPK